LISWLIEKAVDRTIRTIGEVSSLATELYMLIVEIVRLSDLRWRVDLKPPEGRVCTAGDYTAVFTMHIDGELVVEKHRNCEICLDSGVLHINCEDTIGEIMVSLRGVLQTVDVLEVVANAQILEELANKVGTKEFGDTIEFLREAILSAGVSIPVAEPANRRRRRRRRFVFLMLASMLARPLWAVVQKLTFGKFKDIALKRWSKTWRRPELCGAPKPEKWKFDLFDVGKFDMYTYIKTLTLNYTHIYIRPTEIEYGGYYLGSEYKGEIDLCRPSSSGVVTLVLNELKYRTFSRVAKVLRAEVEKRRHDLELLKRVVAALSLALP